MPGCWRCACGRHGRRRAAETVWGGSGWPGLVTPAKRQQRGASRRNGGPAGVTGRQGRGEPPRRQWLLFHDDLTLPPWWPEHWIWSHQGWNSLLISSTSTACVRLAFSEMWFGRDSKAEIQSAKCLNCAQSGRAGLSSQAGSASERGRCFVSTCSPGDRYLPSRAGLRRFQLCEKLWMCCRTLIQMLELFQLFFLEKYGASSS